MNDTWTHRLSEYVDDALSPRERDACERHLETCPDCRETLSALRAVRQLAGALLDPPAPDDLWAGIANRIGPAGSTNARVPRVLVLQRRRAFGMWPSLAAAAATIAIALGAVWFALGVRRAVPARDPIAAGETSGATTRLATFDATRVDGEIAQLQRVLDRDSGKLDPRTVAVLERNLALIRQATEDARRALAQDPANRELHDYFAANVQGKLDLMRRATAMAGM
jgi:hypothetical protein